MKPCLGPCHVKPRFPAAFCLLRSPRFENLGRPAMPPKIATIQEPFGNAVDTVLAEPVDGKIVLITGCGPIGLFAVCIARAEGATMILATDLNPSRLDIAKSLGADHTLNPREDSVVDQVRSLTKGAGVDVLCEMSGNQAAIRDGFSVLAPGGRVSLLGLLDGDVSLDLNNDVIFRGSRIYGITGRRIFDTWERTADLLNSGKVDVGPIITHELPLDEFERGMEILRKGEGAKVVLYP